MHNGDRLADLLIGASLASPEGRSRAGESYVVSGKPGGDDVELQDFQAGRGGFAIRGSVAGDRSGGSVSGTGDVNGDGFADDFAILSRVANTRYASLWGAAYVVFGPRVGPGLPRFRRGAVRGEASLNISDGIALLGYLFLGEAEPQCLEAADAKDDDTLNLNDIDLASRNRHRFFHPRRGGSQGLAARHPPRGEGDGRNPPVSMQSPLQVTQLK